MDKKTKVAAIGAGRMGRGLAHVFAYAGHEVKLLDAKKRKRRIDEFGSKLFEYSWKELRKMT